MIVVYEKSTTMIIAFIPEYPTVVKKDGRFSITGTHAEVHRANDKFVDYKYFHDGAVPSLQPGLDEEDWRAPTLEDLELIPLTPEEIEALLNPRDLGAEVDEINIKVRDLETRVDNLATNRTPPG